MADRKEINKYIDPEYDSTLVTIEKKKTKKVCDIRMMLPMTVKCSNCNTYMYIGKKYNMKMEEVANENYLGIKIQRFYFNCNKCFAVLTFKTDPKNHDYVCEWGIKRKHDYWKDMALAEEEYKQKKADEMKEDAMKCLEHKKNDTKIEMDLQEAIDQVKKLNKKNNILGIEDKMLQELRNTSYLSKKLTNIKTFNNSNFIENSSNKIIDKDNDFINDIEIKNKFMNAKIKRVEDFFNESEKANINKSNINKKLLNKFIAKNSIANISDSESDSISNSI